MKRILILLLVLALFMGVMPHALADELKWGNLLYKVNDNETITITGADENALNIVIPEEIDGMPVTAIGGYAQWGKIESVTIPDSVTTIGDYAFSSRYELKKIYGGKNIEYVGEGAFLSTGYNNTENYKNGVLYIGSAAVYSHWNNTPAKVEILSGTKCIAADAFNSRDNVTEVILPEGIKTIGQEAFKWCENLTKINIPDSIELIDEDAFYNTAIYNDEANWENSVLYVGNSLIKAQESLGGEYTVREGTKVIAGEAFYYCNNLTAVNIPEGVVSIGEQAFAFCNKLKKINLPKSLKNIRFAAFEGDEFESVYIADVESYLSADLKDNPVRYAQKLYINGKRAVNIEIPDTIKYIAPYAFATCDSIASVKIPASVKTIGDSAFYDCTALKTITIEGEGLEKIGEYAFSYCALESITLPKGLKEFGYKAFANCSKLISITIPDGILSISGSAFNSCYALEKVTMSDSVETIERYAFNRCKNLADVKLSKNLKTIGESAFYDCCKLKNISLPQSVTAIGKCAFEYCGLESIVIPSGVKNIEGSAFYCCSVLRYIKINSGTENIGENAFAGCVQLEKIIIPKSVSEIENDALCNAGVDISDYGGICTVEYEGSKEDFESIYIGASGNEFFETAKINYNSPLAGDIKNNAVTVTKTINEGVYLFDIKLSKTTENCFVYAAIYNEDDKIIAVRKAAIDESGNAKVYLNQKSGESYFKIFTWYGTQPIAKTVRQNF